MTIHNLIRTRRVELGLTQKTIGTKCGYKGATAQALVAQWEAGSKSIPRNKLMRLDMHLDLNVQDLIPKEEDA
jgi:transcriptional regulator with XRE-family HTH domain